MRLIKIQKISNNKNTAINLVEMKHLLRIDTDVDDALLNEVIRTAESELEKQTSETLMASDWSMQVLNFSGNFLEVNRKNIRNVYKIMMMKAGKMVELGRELYTYSKGVLWFHQALCTKTMEIVFNAGHTKATDIDPEIITAIKQRIVSIYENKPSKLNYFTRFRDIRI